MAVVKMQKIALFTIKKNLEKILSVVQKFGNFEILSNSDLKSVKNELEISLPSWEKLEKKIAEINFVIKFLEKFSVKPTNFREKFLGDKIEISENSAEQIFKNFDHQNIVEKCNEFEEKVNQLSNELQEITGKINALKNWKSMNFSIDKKMETQFSQMKFGSIAARNFDDFFSAIKKINLAEIFVFSKNAKEVFLGIIFHKNISEKIYKFLEDFKFSEMHFFGKSGKVTEELENLKNQKDIVIIAQENLQQSLKNFSNENLKNCKIVSDFLHFEKEKMENARRAAVTKKIIIFSGWVPEEKIEVLQKKINQISSFSAIEKINPKKNEPIPVALKNNKWFRPFEHVTKLFGLPVANELDPTPFLAPFFAIFFGFCLTDAGYGILMTILLSLGLKFLPLDRSTKEMLQLLIYGSIATIFMGILFGGWFGLSVDQLSILKNPATGKFYGQIFDPINDLVPKIMGLAYALGILHLWFGVILSGINKIKNNDKIGGIAGNFLLAFLFLPITFLILAKKNIFLPNLANFWEIFIFALLPVLTWGMGDGKNILVRFFSGILGVVNEIMSWLSNVLSYSRLFALGLATGIIGMVFNSVASTIGGMMPVFIGIPVMIIIILFGHILNLGLNVLGAFIHSGRLQFVEFFGKFLEGGGQKFSPLCQNPKFIWNPEK